MSICRLFFTLILLSGYAVGQSFKTVGYLPTYRFGAIANMELDKLTHLNIAFANPDVNGNLSTNGVDINSVVQQAQAVGLPVYIALAGGAAQLSDWENWIKPANRAAFIHGIMQYVQQHNLQGVDVDIEWSVVNQDYSGFVLALKDSLDQYNLGITAALPGTYRYPEVSPAALAAFDWVNLMAYDLTGPWNPTNPGPHSPYSFAVNSINYWVNEGLEKSRMTLGVPFYAYDFTDQANVKALTFSQVVAMDTAYAQLDQVGQIYYNGLPTIEQKTQLALNEVSGIMIWEIGQDDFSEFSLLNRIYETIEAANPASIDNPSPKVALSLYPNPVSDVLYIDIETDLPMKVELTLFNQAMQKIYSIQSASHQDVQLDMRKLPAGLYYLGLSVGEHAHYHKVMKK